MPSAVRRQIISGGAPMNKSRRGQRPQIVGGGSAARRSTRCPFASLGGPLNYYKTLSYYRDGTSFFTVGLSIPIYLFCFVLFWSLDLVSMQGHAWSWSREFSSRHYA